MIILQTGWDHINENIDILIGIFDEINFIV